MSRACVASSSRAGGSADAGERLAAWESADEDARDRRAFGSMAPVEAVPDSKWPVRAMPWSPEASGKRRASTDARWASGRGERKRARARPAASEWDLGTLGALPTEILELVMLNLDARDLGRLAMSCAYFNSSGIVERVAAARLEQVPRADALVLTKQDSYLKAWHHCTVSELAERAAGNVSLGQFHSACVVAEGEGLDGGKTIATFGRGFHGQLGLGSYDNHASPAFVRLGQSVAMQGELDFEGVDSIAVGGSHCVVLSRNGGVVSWGLASSGELGFQGTTPIEVNVPKRILFTPFNGAKITQITTGTNHTMAVDEAGRLYACGRGRHGQLGHGDFRDCATFHRIQALKGMPVVSAVCGGSHSICITSDGNVWAWGDCRYGQLGLGDLTFAAAAGWNNGVPWPCLVESLNDMDEPVASIAAGGAHSIFVTAGGRMYVCGRGKHGALGVGKSACCPVSSEKVGCRNRLSPEPVNIHHFVRRTDGNVDVNRVQQCSCGLRCRVAIAAAGATHSCVLTSCGGVFTTGENSYGQLGHGDKKASFVFTRVEALRGKRVTTVAAGYNHTGALVENKDSTSSLYIWGRGDWGQLGTGNMRSHTVPQRVKEFNAALARPKSEALMYKQNLESRDAAESENDFADEDDAGVEM